LRTIASAVRYRAFALQLIGEGSHKQQQLVGRAFQGALPVLQIEEHADAGRDELLQRVRGLNLLAAESRLLGQDEHLEDLVGHWLGRWRLRHGVSPPEGGRAA